MKHGAFDVEWERYNMSVYTKRKFIFEAIESFGDTRLKTYTIMAEGRTKKALNPMLRFAKKSLAESTIPWMKHEKLGYIIYHIGEDADWLLTRVWCEGGIVTGLIAADYGNGWALLATPCVECVWEAVVTEFERNAWVRNMLTETPNAEAYLNDRLGEGHY